MKKLALVLLAIVVVVSAVAFYRYDRETERKELTGQMMTLDPAVSNAASRRLKEIATPEQYATAVQSRAKMLLKRAEELGGDLSTTKADVLRRARDLGIEVDDRLK
jgi:hypothetical protein